MINLFNLFLKENKIKEMTTPAALSILFNKWVKAIANARNKKISNEATKFQIRKWNENRKLIFYKG